MVTALLTCLLLTQGPDEAPRRTPAKLTWKLSVGSFLGSVWAAPSYREQIERFKSDATRDFINHEPLFESQHLVYAAPIIGPWMTLAHGGQQAQEDLWLLVTSGALQGIGLTALTYRLLTQGPASSGAEADGSTLELSFSPYVAGRLGLSVTLTGF